MKKSIYSSEAVAYDLQAIASIISIFLILIFFVVVFVILAFLYLKRDDKMDSDLDKTEENDLSYAYSSSVEIPPKTPVAFGNDGDFWVKVD